MNLIQFLENKGNTDLVDILFINIGYIYRDIRIHSERVIESFTYDSVSITAVNDTLKITTTKLQLTFTKETFTKNLNGILHTIISNDNSMRSELLRIVAALDYFFKQYHIKYIRYIGVLYVYLI